MPRRPLIVLLVCTVLLLSCRIDRGVSAGDLVASDSASASSPAPGAVEPTPTETTTLGEDQDTEQQTPPTDDLDSDQGVEQRDATSGPLFVLEGELPLGAEEVDELIVFIEAETGRPFLRPPVIVAQSDEAFEAGLADSFDSFVENAEKTVRGLQSLGLTNQGVGEVTEAFQRLLRSPEGILGYYDPEVDQLFVPVDVLGDNEFRGLLVHELTHALDGQYVDFNRLGELAESAEVSGDYEAATSFQTVIEGRATAVQERWFTATGTPRDLDLDMSLIEAVPPALVLSLGLPYGFGAQLIESNGGPGNTWDLLENPPASTEEAMIPLVPIGVQPIVGVEPPAADGPILDEFVFGAADMLIWLLGETLQPAPSTTLSALVAADGWAGGRSVLWGDDEESCTRIKLAADTETDLDEIQAVADEWATGAENRSVLVGDDRVIVTGCAPYKP